MVDPDGCFVWYELMTADKAAAKAFYADVMGWGARDPSTRNMTYALFTAGNAAVAGLMAFPEAAKEIGAVPRWIGYVGVDDVDATVEQIKQLGGAVLVPPKDIPNVSRFSVLADPETATFGLFKWLSGGPRQAVELGQPGHVSWHELLAADAEKAFAFYSRIFGWRKAEAEVGPIGIYQPFSSGGQTTGGIFTKPATAPFPFWLYYFGVADIDAAAERVRTGGGQILEGPLEIPGGSWVTRCLDPQGAIFALEGKRSSHPLGYFKRVVAGDPASARARRFTG
ncbi:hypothetical protein SAMN05444581_1358 [Methylocapsa palsarum]|uniref:VOC domain-containing protein n=2 Tax=Methylocapsa palsarum TaxID=1612308 RepID=A0A1I4D3E9_9HYPH|nr:hypothetical protein SAMN05444581_1358 [Methylocapsa palsarum]